MSTKFTVGAAAAELGISTRHFYRIVPGLKKARNGRNIDWSDPKIMKWFRNEVRIRTGEKKRPAKRKARLSNAQRFARVIGRVEKQVLFYLESALKNPTSSELEKLGKALRRLKEIYNTVNLRILAVSALDRRASDE